MNSYALLSVSDKSNIIEVAQALLANDVQLMSTGGTYQVLSEAGLPVESVESYTEFPEMMDGRVKTLHPKIHGGLLGRRSNEEHMAAADLHQIRRIDYVIVNLYPFKETISKANVTFEEAIENIDIGGPSMLRSAAKNFEDVTVVTDPRDYRQLIESLNNDGKTTLAFRKYLAEKVFQLTAYYDSLIANYLGQESQEYTHEYETNDWSHLTLSYENGESLRYGENSHQNAKVYQEVKTRDYSMLSAKQLNGKQLSYNNYKDADAALKIAGEFTEPVAVAVKHMNPCGVGIGESIEIAFDRCFTADPVSIFGGILVLNRKVTLSLAEKLKDIFLEIIIAPEFDEDALSLLSKKANLRLMTLEFDNRDQKMTEVASIMGGILIQDLDQSEELPLEITEKIPNGWETMTERIPTLEEIKAMNLAMKICKHVKSNAIVIANEKMSLGIGAGQMNRVGAAKIALEQAAKLQSLKDETVVMASDAFFPFGDTVALANEYGVKAVIQPGGSLKDQESVDVCNHNNMTMVKTHLRHFRH